MGQKNAFSLNVRTHAFFQTSYFVRGINAYAYHYASSMGVSDDDDTTDDHLMSQS